MALCTQGGVIACLFMSVFPSTLSPTHTQAQASYSVRAAKGRFIDDPTVAGGERPRSGGFTKVVGGFFSSVECRTVRKSYSFSSSSGRSDRCNVLVENEEVLLTGEQCLPSF